MISDIVSWWSTLPWPQDSIMLGILASIALIGWSME